MLGDEFPCFSYRAFHIKVTTCSPLVLDENHHNRKFRQRTKENVKRTKFHNKFHSYGVWLGSEAKQMLKVKAIFGDFDKTPINPRSKLVL